MRMAPVAVAALLLAGAWRLSADTAIGQIQLSGPNLNSQTITVLNLMGGGQGCGVGIFGSQYDVCNNVNIVNWSLQIDFTAEVAGLPTSPVTFTSQGSQDDIVPVDSAVDNAYSGDPSNPWSIAFDQTNAGCSPTCDAQITEIIFSGTVDQSTLQLYNGSGPYIPESLSSQNFSLTWMIPSSDYTDSPGNLFDETDITISQQPAVPEPATVWLVLGAGIAFGLLWRTGLLSTRRQ
jgi:hypothetical protein